MTRVKGGTVSKNRRRKVLKEAKGYFGSKHRLYKTAQEQVFHSGNYAFRDRRQNKRNFRKLWITRINAACRMNEISYSKFINGLNLAGVTVNRKMLAELAIDSPEAFTSLVAIAKDALNGKKYEPKAVAASKSASVKEVSEDSAKTKKTAAKKTTTKKATTEKVETKKTTTKKTTTAKKTTKKAE
ncbi:50S ribosomal protein L20 [Coprobacillus sp. CAG:605]|nr:50S ribosomal protein L20 [Coprobacillus sp. CAG:605]